jgi:hypothetical protein
MSIIKKIAVGALATVGVLAVKNRKAIASELKTDLGKAKRAVKALPATAKSKARKLASSSKSTARSAGKTAKRKVAKARRSGASKRTKSRK